MTIQPRLNLSMIISWGVFFHICSWWVNHNLACLHDFQLSYWPDGDYHAIERHSPCCKRLRSVVESLLDLEFWVGPLINKAVHCSSIKCFNAEDLFITGASSQVSCWQCVSGTFSTAAGALRIVILCDYKYKIRLLRVALHKHKKCMVNLYFYAGM